MMSEAAKLELKFMSKQVITLSDRAAERVKEIMAKAKEPIIGCKSGSCFRRMCRHVVRYGVCEKN